MKTETNGHRSSSSSDPQLLHLAHEHASAQERMERTLRHIADVEERQAKRSRLFTSTFTSSVATAGNLFLNLHLPEESAIAGAYIENNSTLATLTLYEGAGGGGRLIGIVPPSHSKRIALADHISSISVVADKPDPGSAIVFVTLSTRQWSPTQGAL
jgi:hypothetical protein